MSAGAFPWTLRLELEAAASLRVERRGRTVRFDPLPPSPPGVPLGETPPWKPISAADIVVITDPAPERLAGTVAAAQAGAVPTVVADPAVLDWLSKRGEIHGLSAPQSLDGLQIEVLPYAPARRDPLADPGRALRRLWTRGPRCAPWATQITLERNLRLCHLNLSLHNETPEAWLADALARFRGADWLVVGVPLGSAEAVLTLLPRFEARRVLVADLTGEGRGAPQSGETPLTPLVDRMVADGVEAYVFATRSSLRFE